MISEVDILFGREGKVRAEGTTVLSFILGQRVMILTSQVYMYMFVCRCLYFYVRYRVSIVCKCLQYLYTLHTDCFLPVLLEQGSTHSFFVAKRKQVCISEVFLRLIEIYFKRGNMMSPCFEQVQKAEMNHNFC